jgi:hypothetical protein
VINISNYTGEDNSLWLPVQPARTATTTGAPTRTAAGGLAPRGHVARILTIVGQVLLSWLTAIPRHLGDQLFTMNDAEARWQDWQSIRTHGGLGRRYRDPRFDTLAECARCRGAGVAGREPCRPCQGTGRVTLGERSRP